MKGVMDMNGMKKVIAGVGFLISGMSILGRQMFYAGFNSATEISVVCIVIALILIIWGLVQKD
jgi:hypothetical protein